MKSLYNKTLLSLPIITILMLAFILASNTTSAVNDSVVDQINITVPIACTIAGSGMTSHNASINNGTYQANIGTTTMEVYCNDSEGFAIYVIGFTDEEYGNTTLVGQNTSQTIVTGTATTAGNPDVSNWAMKLNTISNPVPSYPIIIAGSTTDTLKQQGDPDFSNYTLIPDEYTKVAYRTAGTDIGTGAEGSTLTSTYAAYISKTQPSDTYSGKVKYTLVHPYDAGAPDLPVVIDDITYMQDLASLSPSQLITLKDSMTEEAQYQLKDNRDNKDYFISKLKDGNIWMTQNLDLCIGCSGVAALTSENTDLNISGTDAYINGYSVTNDVITWTPANTVITSRSTISNNTVSLPFDTSSQGCYNYYTHGIGYSGCVTPYSAEGGDVYVYTSGTSADDTIFTSESDCTAVHSDGTCPHYHLGNYYSWTAAIASNDSSNFDQYTSFDTASNSICPAGWRMPEIEVTAPDGFYDYTRLDFGQLFTDSGLSYNSDIRGAPFFLVRGGIIRASSRSDIAKKGYYWNSTVDSDPEGAIGAQSKSLYLDSSFHNEYASDYRGEGLAIRCLAR